MKIFKALILSSVLKIGALAVECFAPNLPSVIHGSSHDTTWYTSVAKPDGSVLYLGGKQKNYLHADSNHGELAFVAAYSVDMGTYLWARTYQDSTGYKPKKVYALTLTSDESGLIAAGETDDSTYKVFIYWLSAENGAQMYGGLHL
jgi:hypothetical protein